MTTIDRRIVLKQFLAGAVVTAAGVATIGVTFAPEAAEALPLSGANILKPDNLVQEARVVVVHPRRYHRGWYRGGWHRPRRRRRWDCWWRRGRRVCGWRYW